MKHMTVKFVSTDDEKFNEYIGKLIDALGKNEGVVDGVYVEMVSKQDINQQIDDINEVVMHCVNPDEGMEEIDEILSKPYYDR